MVSAAIESWDEDPDFTSEDLWSLKSGIRVRSRGSGSSSRHYRTRLDSSERSPKRRIRSSQSFAEEPGHQDNLAERQIDGLNVEGDTSQKLSAVNLDRHTVSQAAAETFDEDFIVPDDRPLIDVINENKRTRIRSPTMDCDDDAWGEGSLGVRHGGTRRDSRSGRASALSVASFSPGTSVITMDSDDEGLDGIELPAGQLDLQKLNERRKNQQYVPSGFTDTRAAKEAAKDDFFADIEICEEDLFDGRKLTFNKNVRSTLRSPVKSVSFTNKGTRLPRPVLPSSFSTNRNLSSHLNNDAKPRDRDRTLSYKASMMSLRSNSGAQGLASKKSLPSLRPSQISPMGAPIERKPLIPEHPRRNEKGSEVLSNPTGRGVPSLETSRGKGGQPTTDQREFGHTLTTPLRKRFKWNGTELNSLEDLPLSRVSEKRNEAFPTPRGQKKANAQSMFPPMNKVTVKRNIETSGFMRDTAASRIAREERLNGLARREHGSPVSSWTAGPRGNDKVRIKRNGQKRPHLIKPLGKQSAASAKSILGMVYNPKTFRWEGNDKEIQSFDSVSLTPPRPALIANVNGARGPRIVNGMIFDPTKMRWDKATRPHALHEMTLNEGDDSDEEDDPFKDLEDIGDDDKNHRVKKADNEEDTGYEVEFDDPLVSEEFDVGPDFIRRQNDEELRWRKMVEGWIDKEFASQREWLWDIQRMVENLNM